MTKQTKIIYQSVAYFFAAVLCVCILYSAMTSGEAVQAESAPKHSPETADMPADDHLQVSADSMPQTEEKQYVILLDAGHGGDDYGMRLRDGQNIAYEKDVALSVALTAGQYLTENGMKVIYTRKEDIAIADEQRLEILEETKPDFCISFHISNDEDSSQYGLVTVYNETDFSDRFSSVDFAYLLLDQISTRTGTKALGIKANKEENALFTSQGTVCSEILLGYASNAQDSKLLMKKNFQKKAAKATMQAITEAIAEMEK